MDSSVNNTASSHCKRTLPPRLVPQHPLMILPDSVPSQKPNVKETCAYNERTSDFNEEKSPCEDLTLLRLDDHRNIYADCQPGNGDNTQGNSSRSRKIGGDLSGPDISPTDKDVVKLSENIYLFSNRIIGSHDNVFEGGVRSSVYGVRPCVIKFATINEQNVREAEILTKLGSHTNVIAIIQSGTYHDVFEDRVYIALDKCHNENLRQYLANRKKHRVEYDLSQAINFAKQIIAGVMYIHDNNVIHLDLKPSNILISQNLRLIKIADFGLSIVVKSSKSKVFHKRQFGTNGYRPIESFGNGIVSRRTDIFSLGTVLLHLLSNGNEVFGCDEHIFINNVMNDVTITSGLLVRNPDTTEHLIKCMVSKERCRRPTIWEVFDHPCWSGKEVFCNVVEYFGDDEIDDDVTTDEIFEDDRTIVATTEIEKDREFLKKMKEMGFDRKPTIVLFDDESKHLFCFDYQNGSMRKMHRYPGRRRLYENGGISFGEYIYMFCDYGATYRLEYCDSKATWKRMKDWEDSDFDELPYVVASSSAIFIVYWKDVSRSVIKYDPSSDQYERLDDKPTSTLWSALHCNDEFIYCIGGRDLRRNATNIVERMDLKTMKWTRVSNMNGRRQLPTCTEYRGNIYVIDNSGKIWGEVSAKLQIEMYDAIADRWTELKVFNTMPFNKTGILRQSFVIDGNILTVCSNVIYKYDIDKDEWSCVTSRLHKRIKIAVLVNMSRTVGTTRVLTQLEWERRYLLPFSRRYLNPVQHYRLGSHK